MCVPQDSMAPKRPEPVGQLYSSLKVEDAMTGLAMKQKSFDAESADYDYATAKRGGLGPDGTGDNKGHWGSVTMAADSDKKKHGLPDESYVVLKGRSHPTFDKAVKGEEDRGFKVIKKGARYYSVPGDYKTDVTP